MKAYLALIAAFQSICDASGLSFTEKEIGSFTSAEVEYKGWWTFDALGKLGNVSLRSMTYPDFLARCKDLNCPPGRPQTWASPLSSPHAGR